MREWRRHCLESQHHGGDGRRNGGAGGSERRSPDRVRYVQGPGQGNRDPPSRAGTEVRGKERRLYPLGKEENVGPGMPNNVKVLLVDDNSMVLGMLRGALTPLASVTTATDSADALLKAVDDPPDLLVSDYRMPGMDGRQLVEKLRSRPRTAGIAIILVASKADIAEKLAHSEPVDDFVEKPFFLKDATQRIKRVIDKIALEKMAKSAPSDGVLRGSLSQMN